MCLCDRYTNANFNENIWVKKNYNVVTNQIISYKIQQLNNYYTKDVMYTYRMHQTDNSLAM